MVVSFPPWASSVRASTLQPVCLLANRLHEGVELDGRGTMNDQDRGNDVRCERREFTRDPLEDRTLVLLLGDRHPRGIQLRAFATQPGQEIPDLLPLRAAHLPE